LPAKNAKARKSKAAEAFGFRGPSSPLSHLWGHSVGNSRLSDFKRRQKVFSKNFSFASLPAQK
jgi:hypothetical protein